MAFEAAGMPAPRQGDLADLVALLVLYDFPAGDSPDVAAPQEAILAVAAPERDVEPGARDLRDGRRGRCL